MKEQKPVQTAKSGILFAEASVIGIVIGLIVAWTII